MRHLIPALVAVVATPVTGQDLNMGGISNSWSSTQFLLNSEKKAWAAPECTDEKRWATECKDRRPEQQHPRPPQALDLARGRQVATPGAAVNEAALTFRPSIERRQRNFAQLVSKSRATDPAGALLLQAYVAQDVIGHVAKQVRPLGLRTDNVADAVAIYVMEAWEAANAKPMLPSRARAQAVRRQMANALAGNPELGGTDDAARQELAETMIVQAAMVSDAFQRAKQSGDEREIAAVQAAARQGARESLGIDLRTLSLTEAGLS